MVVAASRCLNNEIVVVVAVCRRRAARRACRYRRIALLRQEAGLTPQAVAAHLGVAQQTLAHYKVGRLKLPVTLVPKLAAFFAVPTDVLLGVASAHPGKRGPTPKL